jgi:energy-coupling factor transporter ATP-binding protein EcfA2
MPPTTRYDEPFHWWGPGWNGALSPDLIDMLLDGTIDEWSAAVLCAAIAAHRSVVVIGGPSGLGKSTLLAALVDFLPGDVRGLYLRGCFETFAFLDDPTIDPQRSVLLINEISPHLPIYLWGPAVSRALDAAERGYALLATAHAESVSRFVASLATGPLHIPTPRLAAFEYVVLMEPAAGSSSGRRVSGIWRLQGTRHGVEIALLGQEVSGAAGNPRSNGADNPSGPLPIHVVRQNRDLLNAMRDRRRGANVAALAHDVP